MSVIFWTTVNAFDTPSDERVLQAPNGASRDRHQCVLAGHLGRVLINRDCSAIAGCRKRRERIALEAQAIFFRRRHQPRRPPPAKIRPGSPAPAMGPGTPAMGPGTTNADEFAVMMIGKLLSGMKGTNSATM